jgi:cytochrome c biogenesis protein CcmG/thiol:disulfide interchange protein DsbE
VTRSASPARPAVESPAVDSAAVELPAVDSAAVELPAVDSAAVESPAVEMAAPGSASSLGEMDTGVRRKAIGRGVLLGVLVTAIVVVALLVFTGGGAGDKATTLGAIPTATRQHGKSVPTADFERFDGTKGTFADYEGTPLVVNFFASWCAPCVREMPDLQQVHSELAGKVTFLGMNNQDRAADGQAIADKAHVTYDLARDPNGDFLSAFGGIVMPTTVFISSDGKVLEVHNGAFSADDLRAEVHKLFGA